MAGSLNKVQLIGHLGADPEIKSFQSGDKVANLRIATSESWKDRDGNKQERTEWHSVAIFGDGLVGIVERYTRKGSKVFLEGQLRTRKWQDQNGNDRYSTEVVLRPYAGDLILLGDPGQGGGGGQRDNGGGSRGGSSGGGQSGGGGGQQRQGGMGWDESRNGPGRQGFGGSGSGTGTGGGFQDDLDDEIPF